MIVGIVKKLFSLLGYEVRNKRYRDIFTIRHTMTEAFSHLKAQGYYPDLVIDIGAAGGTPPLQESFPDSNFFWVEPLEEFRPALEQLTRRYKGHYLIAGMGKAKEEKTIYLGDEKVESSLLKEQGSSGNIGPARVIPIHTLKELAAEKFSGFSKILLKVDVQGFELEVLEGAGDYLDQIGVVVLEVSFFRFLSGVPEFSEVVDYMKKKGFVVYDIVEGINRPLDQALAQKDLVFVKEKGEFRQSHAWQ